MTTPTITHRQQYRLDPSSSSRPKSRLRVVAVLAALCVLVPMFPASSASAHASVTSVSPAPSSVHRTQPPLIAVAFNEVVSTSTSKVQLLNSSGTVVPTKFSTRTGGSSYALVPTKRLAPGGYVLRWSVISADGHLVSGASSFWVGTIPRAGSKKNVVLTSATTPLSVQLSSNRRGIVSFQVPAKTASVEFRHAKIGATLQATMSGSTGTVALPLSGSWNMTVVVKQSEFAEQRHLGRFTLRS